MTQFLASVTSNMRGTHGFDYGVTNGTSAGELKSATLPYGARLRWDLRDFTFTGNRTIREVLTRYLWVPTPDNANPAETSHGFWHNDAVDAGQSLHIVTRIYDATGDKVWYFNGDRTVYTFDQRNASGVVRRRTEYTWTWTDAVNQVSPYVSNVKRTQYGTSTMVSVSEQTLDAYGNVKQTKGKDGDPGSNEKVANYSYLHESGPNASQYLSRYIRNRLTSVSVSRTGSSQVFTPFSASYDAMTIVDTDVPNPLALYDTANYPKTMIYRGNASK